MRSALKFLLSFCFSVLIIQCGSKKSTANTAEPAADDRPEGLTNPKGTPEKTPDPEPNTGANAGTGAGDSTNTGADVGANAGTGAGDSTDTTDAGVGTDAGADTNEIAKQARLDQSLAITGSLLGNLGADGLSSGFNNALSVVRKYLRKNLQNFIEQVSSEKYLEFFAALRKNYAEQTNSSVNAFIPFEVAKNQWKVAFTSEQTELIAQIEASKGLLLKSICGDDTIEIEADRVALADGTCDKENEKKLTDFFSEVMVGATFNGLLNTLDDGQKFLDKWDVLKK